MFKNIRNKIASLASTLVLVAVPLAVPAVAMAATTSSGGPDIQSNLCSAANSLTVDSNTGCSGTTNGTDKVNGIIKTIINIFSIVVGVVAVIMIIVGGFRYITSGGNDSNVAGAKNTIIYALIGLVVVALAQFIVQFVLNKVTQP